MKLLYKIVFMVSFPLGIQLFTLLKVNKNLREMEAIIISRSQLTNASANARDARLVALRIKARKQPRKSIPRKSKFLTTTSLSFQENKEATLSIPVFYNMFTSRTNRSDTERVRKLVSEQLASLGPEHQPVYMHSIGRRLHITNTTLLKHHTEGSEMNTLQSLWEFCKTNKEKKVVYLHSKGSFHPKRDNDLLRNLMTQGALSKDCANLPTSCNVCSSRFSPFPHPHFPGNMFLARCDYVRQLIEPSQFPARMKHVPGVYNETVEWKYGSGRFSSEHWIGSAPSMKPCDLYTSAQFTWGYSGLPSAVDVKTDFKLLPAPRFPMLAYKTMRKTGYWATQLHRLEEYRILYNETPDESWWGWNVRFPI
jgi:hypothetical protein